VGFNNCCGEIPDSIGSLWQLKELEAFGNKVR
jgi:hypothetical protein